ncbi:MAG TPA: 3-hydroxyacyl-CoA dehydrogenase NAD-binding domain-containing protein [Alphaproteobacteria bacterium]|nr:3-hydroxyacyl-CoA dehydrogenase NAD-binding domain-containing protein [Alphaproteobacteria bacterium]
MSAIQKVAVIGSGVMGAQIAAHVTNAGIPVLLLDIVPKDASDRNALAKGAIEKLQKMDPAPFMHSRNAKLVTAGNLEDDLDKLKDVDWIIEAVLENPQIKSDLYKKVDAKRKAGSIVSSNTSTIPLNVLIGGQSEQFARDFLITHFFNPPRYMRLLELVTGPKTRPDAIEVIRDFGDRNLGKGVVNCKDTPGFIANRLGVFFLQNAVNVAIDMGITVEEADAVFSKPVGMPKTGIFGLLDLIGIDLMPLIAKSFLATLPPDDTYRVINKEQPLINKMIADGYTGRKGKGGFYRLIKNETGKVKESIDLKTGNYHVSNKVKLPTVEAAGKNLRALCEGQDKISKFTWAVLSAALAYAAALVPQIADDILSVDRAMQLGFNWKFGPFELIDKLGAGWFAERLKADGKVVPDLLQKAAGKSFYRVENGKLEYLTTAGEYKVVQRPQGVLLLSDIKRGSKPVTKNGSASLWDIGDGILCLEFTSKMNAIDPDTLGMVSKAVETITNSKGQWKGLVVHNESENFSVGANLGLALFAINIAMWPAIENLVKQGQDAYHALRFAPFPSVAAPAGMALGGGCEITLHCSAVQAHAETYIGLVEVGVGLIPGWGGCAQMLGRAFAAKKRFGGPIPPVSHVFETVSVAKVAKSAFDAQDLMYLRHSDGITMNRDRLLYDAKQRVLDLAKDYQPPKPLELNLPGPTGRAALGLAVEGFKLLGKALPHDVTVSKALAAVLCGGEHDLTTVTTEEQILALERREFIKLVHTPESIARIAHMLGTGKPLRN